MTTNTIFERELGEGVLKLFCGIAERSGPGTVKAKRIRDELSEKLANGDQRGTGAAIKAAYSHILTRNYATDDEFTRGKDLLEQYRELVPELVGEIVQNAKDGTRERVQKKRLTVEDLKAYLTEHGIRVRRNVITHGVELTGWNTDGEYSEELESQHFITYLRDDLQDGYTGCSRDDLEAYISLIAGTRGNEYNPVTERIRAEPWDGKDRLEEVYRILGVTDHLSRVLVEKWARQALALAQNSTREQFAGEGVLVLAAPQAAGKSTFAQKIAAFGDLFLPGSLLDPSDRDSVKQNTSRWIVEIGELGSTFKKADLGRLKAFLTRPTDTYRVAYGRDDVTLLRRTSYIATVDSAEFLVDETGNRRWWVVEVEKIDLDALRTFDAVQFWRQISTLLERDGLQSFRLTAEERIELANRNRKHEKRLPCEQELLDILAECNGDVDTFRRYEMKRQSASQIAEGFGLDRKYSAEQIGRALKKIGVESGRAKGAIWYLFPVRKMRSTSVNG